MVISSPETSACPLTMLQRNVLFCMRCFVWNRSRKQWRYPKLLGGWAGTPLRRRRWRSSMQLKWFWKLISSLRAEAREWGGFWELFMNLKSAFRWLYLVHENYIDVAVFARFDRCRADASVHSAGAFLQWRRGIPTCGHSRWGAGADPTWAWLAVCICAHQARLWGPVGIHGKVPLQAVLPEETNHWQLDAQKWRWVLQVWDGERDCQAKARWCFFRGISAISLTTFCVSTSKLLMTPRYEGRLASQWGLLLLGQLQGLRYERRLASLQLSCWGLLHNCAGALCHECGRLASEMPDCALFFLDSNH